MATPGGLPDPACQPGTQPGPRAPRRPVRHPNPGRQDPGPRSACSGWSCAPVPPRLPGTAGGDVAVESSAVPALDGAKVATERITGSFCRLIATSSPHRTSQYPGLPRTGWQAEGLPQVCAELINAQADLQGRNGGSCAALPQARRNRSGTGHRPITWPDRQTRRSGPAAMKALVTHARRRTGGESASNRSSGLDRPEPAGSTRQSGRAAETRRLTCASRTSGWWQLAW